MSAQEENKVAAAGAGTRYFLIHGTQEDDVVDRIIADFPEVVQRSATDYRVGAGVTFDPTRATCFHDGTPQAKAMYALAKSAWGEFFVDGMERSGADTAADDDAWMFDKMYNEDATVLRPTVVFASNEIVSTLDGIFTGDDDEAIRQLPTGCYSLYDIPFDFSPEVALPPVLVRTQSNEAFHAAAL